MPSDVTGNVATAISLGNSDYESVHYKFSAQKWKLPFLNDSGRGGPFAFLDRRHLLFVARCGTLAIVELGEQDAILKHRSILPFADEIYCDGGPDKDLSGVKGMLVRRAAGGERRTVYLTYSFEPQPGCTTLKLVRFDLAVSTNAAIEIGDKSDIFVSSPCGTRPVLHNEIGGVLTESGGFVYFSVGDFGHLRQPGVRADFGTILRFPASQRHPRPQVFATGLRNVLGMTFAPATPRREGVRSRDVLFVTDMGPKGGDEINLVVRNDDLGFPRSSYGIEYGHDTTRDYAGQFDDHRFGKQPLYVFFPSVAPTGIAYYDKAMFRSWRHSLMMVTLRGRTIYRLRLDGARVVYAEPVAATGERMRWVSVAEDGSILVKADPDILIRFFRITTNRD